MRRSAVDFHPAAQAEILQAHLWYWERSQAAADDFLLEVEHALDEIAEAPDRWPKHLYRTRRYVLRRFPFSVVYRCKGAAIRVVAVAHAKRRPGDWKVRTN